MGPGNSGTVDTLGLVVAVVVTAAGLDDRVGLVALLQGYFAQGTQRLRKLWVDGGYRAAWLMEWVRGLKQTYKIDLEVTEKEGPGFQVVKWRWVVERTFAWLLNYRRHSRDYEELTANSEAMIQISMIHLLDDPTKSKSERLPPACRMAGTPLP